MQKYLLIFLLCFSISLPESSSQDTAVYGLTIDLPVLDLPQNKDLPHRYPSMNQSLMLSNDFYDLGFWGIYELSDVLVKPKNRTRLVFNKSINYLLALTFVKYGSELPIPLGVWAHEEYHRAVLGTAGLESMNGNWIFHRWDGTVYGVSDESLGRLKDSNLPLLLYSYVSGIHFENQSTLSNVLNDFYYRRDYYKNALYLYNAYYVWNYFNFSTSATSDSVKVIAPEHESNDPVQRDFAGSDLTAWAFDMFNPDLPYTERELFPGGEGVNRRIGFSDLPENAQEYLIKQKKLSLLNFINPSIFFINRIPVSEKLSFNFLIQYYPTHFGNDISLVVPVRYENLRYVGAIHNYNSYNAHFYGFDAGIGGIKPFRKMPLDVGISGSIWNQPADQDFYAENGHTGGSVKVEFNYAIGSGFQPWLIVSAKSEGWLAGNPYLENNISFQAGIRYSVL